MPLMKNIPVIYFIGFLRFLGIKGTKYSGPITFKDISPPINKEQKINNLEKGFKD
jgi:hypothetical protein